MDHHPELWINAMDNDLEGGHRLLEEGEVNIDGKGGPINSLVSAFYIAITLGDREAIAELRLQHGADTTALHNGLTPMNYVVFMHLEQDTAIVRLLLLYGADIEARITGGGSGFSGETPLSTGVRSGSLGFTQLLLDHGAEVNTMENNFRGFTPLMAAAFYGRTDLVDMLLQYGADIFAQRKFGWTAEKCAALKTNEDIGITLRVARVTCQERCLAVAMGHHERSGDGSLMARIAPELLRMIIQPEPKR